MIVLASYLLVMWVFVVYDVIVAKLVKIHSYVPSVMQLLTIWFIYCYIGHSDGICCDFYTNTKEKDLLICYEFKKIFVGIVIKKTVDEDNLSVVRKKHNEEKAELLKFKSILGIRRYIKSSEVL